MGKEFQKLFTITKVRKPEDEPKSYKFGRWGIEEHYEFLRACEKYGNDLKRVNSYLICKLDK